MRCTLDGLDCANCAAKIEQELNKIKGLEEIKINFATRSIDLPAEMVKSAQTVIDQIEPGVTLIDTSGQPSRKLQKKQERRHRYLIIIAGMAFIAGLLAPSQVWASPGYLLLMTAYIIVGWPVIFKAFNKILHGQLFDESFLMTIATIGAVAIGEPGEAAGVMLFFAIGEYLQERAVNRSRRSIAALMDIQPEFANLQEDGATRQIRPDEVEVGQIILVRPGERVPLDGIVREGASFVNTAALTGESVPRKVEPEEPILAGMINGQGLLTVEVTRPYRESSVARILNLVEKAGERKAPTEQFITRFAHYYTPVVVIAAAMLAVIPPLFIPGAHFNEWLYRSLILLVISCPCALMVSIPLGYFGGIGAASKGGILAKGANYLDALAKVDTVVFDKTGTLTKGVFKVVAVVPADGFDAEGLLETAALAEAFSNHPIAVSIREAYGREIAVNTVRDYREIPGFGIKAVVGGKPVLAGNDRLLHQEAIEHTNCSAAGTTINVVINGVWAGYIVIADQIKPDAAEAVLRLKQLGVKQIIMLTGDEDCVAREVAVNLKLDRYYAGLLPEEKVAKVEQLQAEFANRDRQKLAFVGDGINDAPVITGADIGVAMGALGSDAAIEAADIVLMEDAPSKLAVAIELARQTRRIVKQNIYMALLVKAFFITLGGLGIASIWEAVFADVGVTLAAVLNASRTMKFKSGLK